MKYLQLLIAANTVNVLKRGQILTNMLQICTQMSAGRPDSVRRPGKNVRRIVRLTDYMYDIE